MREELADVLRNQFADYEVCEDCVRFQRRTNLPSQYERGIGAIRSGD